MFAVRIITSLLLLFFWSTASSQNVAEVRRNRMDCENSPESLRQECGFAGITPAECVERDCCFRPSEKSGVPWCYLKYTAPISTQLLKTTQPPAAPTKHVPDWIQALMNVSVDVSPKKSTITSGGQQISQLPLLTLEIRDELMCQNTYRLFKKIRGTSRCDINLITRESCIEQKQARTKGKSECSACTKIGCCYDPVIKKVNGRRVPHCYKTKSMTTPLPPTTATTAAKTTRMATTTESSSASKVPKKVWSGIHPEYQPGNPPPKTIRVSQNQANPFASLINGGGTQNLNQLSSFLPSLGQNTAGNSLATSNNIFGLLSSLKRPSTFTSTAPPSTMNKNPLSGSTSNIANILSMNNNPSGAEPGLATSSSSNNMMNMLSMLNKPSGTTQTTSSSSQNNMLNILSLLNKPSENRVGAATGSQQSGSSQNNIFNLLSLMNKPTGTSASSSAGSLQSSGSSTSNMMNILSLLNNRPGSSSVQPSSTNNVLNILSSLNKPAQSTTTSTQTSERLKSIMSLLNPPKSSQSSTKTGSSTSQLLASLLNPTGGTSSSNSALTKLLLNRINPTKASQSATVTGGGNSLSSIFSNLLGNSMKTVPSEKLTTTSKPRPSTTPFVQRPSAESYKDGIPVIFETESRALPARTCYPRNCGHRATDGQITHRIVGGQWTGGMDYSPWTCSVRRSFFDDDRFIHVCGGTIIARRWILTAGHCFMAYQRRGVKIIGKKEDYPSVYSIHIGKYFRDKPPSYSSDSPDSMMQVCEIESYEAHPDYDYRTLKHDIAVAKLKEPIRFTNTAQPACLPGKQDILTPGDKSWVTGWGETLDVGEQNRSKLKELKLPLIANSKCKKSWPKHFHEAWICTEGAYLEDACAGDSGGPLVKRGSDFRWDLIGVAIAGTRTCSTVKSDIRPGIYTKVAYYRDFIDVATGGACDDLGLKL